MNKKKIIVTVISVIAVIGIIAGGIAMYIFRYSIDRKDTEDLYRQNVASVSYENTIEAAYPQTDLHKIIDDHFRSELPEGKTEKKAIILGYDGCRADVLTEVQDENSAIGYLMENGASKNLTYCGGINYPAENTQATSTAPGWCSILTGQWADVHGVTANDIPKTMDAKTLLTTLTEDGIIGSASFITKWAGHFSRENATYLPEVQYCTDHALPVTFNKCKDNDESHKAVMAEIADEACSDFLFVIYEHTDSEGHSYGFTINNPGYKEAFVESDACAYEAIKAIEARETFDTEDWLIIITSDHGGIGTGHGHESIQERMTFVVMNKEWS